MTAQSSDDSEKISVKVDGLTREDTIVMNEGGAVIEKGLVLHGCTPPVRVGDSIIAVNGEIFQSCEDLTQLIACATQTGTNFTLTVHRQKGEAEEESKIDRYIIELKRDNVNIPFGITANSENGNVYISTVDGIAAEAGIREKDFVKSINGNPVNNTDQFQRLLRDQLKVALYLARGAKVLTRKNVELEEKIINVHVPFEKGDILGIDVDSSLTVTKIQPGSIGENKFEVLDKLIDVNGMKMRDDKEFYSWLQRLDDDLDVNLLRSVVKKDKMNDTQTSEGGINRVLISLAMTPYEPVGVRPDEKLMITRIMDRSHAQGRFELGDVIKLLNGIPIKDRNQFFKLFEDATSEGRVNILVERSASREFELEKRQLPPNIEKIVKRHAGFDYIVVDVRYDPESGRPFGLNIANVTLHKVMIPELAENCVAGDYLKPYDHIIAINGNPVSEVKVAKQMIRDCRGNFQAVVERPITLESNAQIKHEIQDWKLKVERQTLNKNMEEMPADVQQIVAAHKQAREKKKEARLVSALRKNATPRRVRFRDQHRETQIQSDVPASKYLRPCR